MSVLNLFVGEKFSSLSLRPKSSSFLNLSKENVGMKDDSSDKSVEEGRSFLVPPTISPDEPSSPSTFQIPVPAPRKISGVSLPGRLTRSPFRLRRSALLLVSCPNIP